MTTSRLEPNLAALRRWLPRMAEVVESAPLPPEWQSAIGTDGTPTYCRTTSNDQLLWLGRTSMPASSAAALVHAMTPGTENGVGLGMGTGYEWLAFLGQLTANQTLYVLEPDPLMVRLALTICALTEALAAGRIILVTGPTAAVELLAFLDRHPGFEPPAVLHPLPTLDPAGRNALLAQAEQMVRDAVLRRSQRIAEALARLQALPPPTDPQRRLVLALQQGGPAQRPLRAASRGWARRHPEKAAELLIDRHDSAGLLVRVDAALSHNPAVIVSDLFRSQLGPCVPPGARVETWVAPTPPAGFWFNLPNLEQSVAGDRVICHSSAQQGWLVAAGAADVQVLPLAIPAETIAEPAGALAVRHSVVLLGDLPTMDPDAYGARLPSHAAVWNAARELILEDPLAIHADMLPDLFRRAQARVGVQIIEESLARMMEQAIGHVLAVSGVALGLARLLRGAGFMVRCIGSGWQTPETQGLGLQVLPMPGNGDWNDLWTGAAILLHYNAAGIVHPLLLHAATADVVVVAPEHPRAQLPGGIATLFDAGAQFVAPARRNAVPAIKDLLRDGAKRKALADATRARVMAQHTWDCRAKS